MKLYAISDLHLDYPENRRELERLPFYPEDWLILAGDISHREEDLSFAFSLLNSRFRQLIWVPGNHELWTYPSDSTGLRGEAKYQQLVSICRHHKVLTPEDPYVSFTMNDRTYVLVPLFLLYDYSFRPEGVSLENAVAWALETDVLCADEHFLHSDPYPGIAAWSTHRCDLTEQRLLDTPREDSLILINHFPLRQDLIRIYVPRFSIWCGTRRTESWHTRYNVSVVISGHLHTPYTQWRDGVRFEEVSLGYPRQWRMRSGIESHLRQILPNEKTM